MWCSIYIVYPLVLSRSNLKLHQTLEVKNFLNKENGMFQLTFNPGLTLTDFRTTRPSIVIGHFRLLFFVSFGAKPFAWKRVWSTGSFSRKSTHSI